MGSASASGQSRKLTIDIEGLVDIAAVIVVVVHRRTFIISVHSSSTTCAIAPLLCANLVQVMCSTNP